MNIETKFFGEIEIDNNLIIRFESGIPGFEKYKDYIILDVEEKKFKCLQSTNKADLCFILISPWDYFEEYEISLSDDEIQQLNINNSNEVSIFNIVTVGKDNITTNLIAPIVINVFNRQAKQIVLTNSKYKVKEVIKCLY